MPDPYARCYLLFKAATSDQYHVLHGLLPATRSQGHNLRPRAHNYVLPAKDDRNFIPRMLYRDMYWAIDDFTSRLHAHVG
jgi:hypothetical protein